MRRLEIGVLLAGCESSGGSLAFGARTLRHHQGQFLGSLWPQLSACYNAVTVDKSVRRIREQLGFVGYIRAAEVTHGSNGWHPHIHPSYFFDRRISVDDIAELDAAEVRAWTNKAVRLGLAAPLDLGQHLHLVTGEDAAQELGQYFTKAGHQAVDSVAWEMTSSQTKTGRHFTKTVTPWVLLAGAREGDADALDLWHEYERVSKGKRALTYSRGIRDRYGLLAEATDEEVAAAEVGSSEDALFEILDWSPVREHPRLGADLLVAVRQRGLTGGLAFCRKNGIETEVMGGSDQSG